MYNFDPIAVFQNEHHVLTSTFVLHQTALVEHAWIRAARLFDQYKRQLQHHIDLEDRYLIPNYDAVKARDQWPVRVYSLEHRRIGRLIEQLGEVFLELTPDGLKPPELITILDAEKTLKNALDHHHRREESAMYEALHYTIPETVRGALVEAMLQPEDKACHLDR